MISQSTQLHITNKESVCLFLCLSACLPACLSVCLYQCHDLAEPTEMKLGMKTSVDMRVHAVQAAPLWVVSAVTL